MENLRGAVNGRLHFDGCDAVELAETYGTPLYVMSETALRERLREIKRDFVDAYPDAFAVYASKAFQTLDMCRLVAAEGLGLDVVSGGELHAALKAGFDPEKIYFHGNGKTVAELREAVAARVGRVVVDSLDELRALDRIAQEAGVRQRILFRVTPGVDSHTHSYVSTGTLDSKFGIPLDPRVRDDHLSAALSAPGVELLGFHFHVGSQLMGPESHLLALEVLVGLMAEARSRFGFETKELNMGGGFGVRYVEGDEPAPPAAFVRAMMAGLERLCAAAGLRRPRVVIEPGRFVVGEAGMTLYRVSSVKEIPGVKTWVAVDGGMTDNPRPALYGAVYEAVLANKYGAAPGRVCSIAGKCCESGDVLVRDVALPDPQAGDLVAVFTTGAYNHSMASNYNRALRPAVVLTSAGAHRLSVRRETYDDLLAREL